MDSQEFDDHAASNGSLATPATATPRASKQLKSCDSSYGYDISKSNATRPIRPFCKRHGVGYMRSSEKANSKSEEPCLQGCVPMGLLGSDDRAPPT